MFKVTQEMLDQAVANGFVEVSAGVYINSQENMIADQQSWDDEDAAKDMDFSSAEFWVTTDDGVVTGVELGSEF